MFLQSLVGARPAGDEWPVFVIVFSLAGVVIVRVWWVDVLQTFWGVAQKCLSPAGRAPTMLYYDFWALSKGNWLQLLSARLLLLCQGAIGSCRSCA
jgi:hypothetical protein